MNCPKQQFLLILSGDIFQVLSVPSLNPTAIRGDTKPITGCPRMAKVWTAEPYKAFQALPFLKVIVL